MMTKEFDFLKDDEYSALYSFFFKKYGNPLGFGLNRVVWKTPNGNVVKVPRWGAGNTDNDWEASVCEDDIYPKTKGIWLNGIVICVMEYITPVENIDYEKLPDWVGSIDCGQVGYTSSGKLKPYDYGNSW